ncbi:MAG: macro domain-containing protein [Candidatus Thiodiazotropha sp.]|jgi:O-acetyl-ADP-ribose deacetylase
MTQISIKLGDITKENVDCIVNAANAALSGGGGVDGAIHKASGPLLLEECRQLGRCAPGECCITDAYNLPVKRIIHAVGPVWSGGVKNEEALLSSVYSRSLALCNKESLHSIAFPNISCGAYKFPIQLACNIALTTVNDWLENNANDIHEVRFICYDPKILKIFINVQNLMQKH